MPIGAAKCQVRGPGSLHRQDGDGETEGQVAAGEVAVAIPELQYEGTCHGHKGPVLWTDQQQCAEVDDKCGERTHLSPQPAKAEPSRLPALSHCMSVD